VRKYALNILVILLIIIGINDKLSCQIQASGDLLTLESAVETAMKNNLQLKAARNAVDASKWGVRRSTTSLLPKVEVGQRLTQFDNETVWRANIFIDIAKEQWGVDVPPIMFKRSHATVFSIMQPIYNGGANITAIKIARITDKNNKLTLEDTKQEITLQVKNAFYGYQNAREMVALQEQSRELARENLKSAKSKRAQGMGSDPEVLRWEVQLATEEERLVEYNNILSMAEMNLKNIMGVDLLKKYQILPVSEDQFNAIIETIGESEITQNNVQQWIDRAKDSNPSIKMMKTNTELAGANVSMAWSNLLPKVNFNYSRSWQENNTLDLDGFKTWNAAISMNIPIFNSFSDVSGIKEAKYNALRAAELEKDYERAIVVNVVNTILGIKSVLTKLEFAKKSAEQARENLRIVRKRYSLGIASNLDLIDAQVANTGAQANLISAKYDLLFAADEFNRIIGEEVIK